MPSVTVHPNSKNDLSQEIPIAGQALPLIHTPPQATSCEKFGLELPTIAHSALDFREPAALAIAGAVCRGEFDELAVQALKLDQLPARVGVRLLWKVVDMAAAERALPPLRRGISCA